MMERLWSSILECFGEDVILRKDTVDISGRALIQPLPERGKEQEMPGPLDADTVVEWKGKEYRVQRAHLMGEGVCPHWWAVLCPGEEAL